MNRMSALCSWSGGKDSCLAYYRAREKGINIKHLMNFVSKESKRGCFHGIAADLLKLQADLIGVDLIQEEVTADMQEYEKEFKKAVRSVEGIEAMVFGDIYLLDHENWVSRVCKEMNITAIEPLWNNNPQDILDEFIGLGFKAIIVSAQADKLDEHFIGRQIDRKLVEEFKKMSICPCGENGEFHTLVIDGPIFKRPIEILERRVILKEGFWKHWFLDIVRYS